MQIKNVILIIGCLGLAGGLPATAKIVTAAPKTVTRPSPEAKPATASAAKPVQKQKSGPATGPAPTAVHRPASNYPWHRDIVTTVFWVGQGCTSYNSTTNYQSAWDSAWTKNYGGLDDPARRLGFTPRKFAATLNPFYAALPFNDVKYPDKAKKYCPWYKTPHVSQKYVSQCKGRWLAIRNSSGKVCYCQWEDVGPLTTDHAEYVFGNDRPKVYSKAGLDISPAAATFLGINGKDITDWRFVEAWEVPPGPWIKYGEQAIIFSALKKRETRKK
jgi:hypothetical protein